MGDIKLEKQIVCLNLNESEFKFEYEGYEFYFSSNFNRRRFIERLPKFIDEETRKLNIRYNVNISFDIIFMISFYKIIEKRGFRIYDLKNKKEVSPSCGIIAEIKVY